MALFCLSSLRVILNTHILSIHSFIFFPACFRHTMVSEGSLRVHGVQLNDAGRYYCTVSNQAGSDHRGVDLRVFGE